MYNYNTTLFKTDNELKFYIIGFIAADGYIFKDRKAISIELSAKDRNFIEMLRGIICPDRELKYRPNTNSIRFSINNAEIYDEVIKYFNTFEKTKKLLFPYGIPDEHIRHYMRGYSDGDGNIGVKRAKRILKSGIEQDYYGLRYRVLGTRQFLDGFAFNMNRLCGVTKANTHKKGDEDVYYIEYGFSGAERALNFIYDDSNIKLDRKYQVFRFISESDSDFLRQNYNTDSGHYNTHGVSQYSETKI